MRDFKALTQVNKILRNPLRQRLLELIKSNPGMSVTKIQIAIREKEHCEISHALGMLRRIDLIRAESKGKLRLYYYNTEKEQMLKALNNIAEKIIRKK